MYSFSPILSQALFRKGGEQQLDSWITEPLSDADFKKVPDNRALAEMTRCVFQAGFVWKVIERKWPDFEKVFFGFEPHKLVLLNPAQLDRICADKRIVRNRQKIVSVPQNAAYILDLSKRFGSFSHFASQWRGDDYIGLCLNMKKFGCRLGGLTGPRILRKLGKDGFMLTNDVVTCLKATGLEIANNPTSKSDLMKIQNCFNAWQEQTGFSLTRLSKICACATGKNYPMPVG